MKVLLCSINSKYIHSSLAVWYLFSAVKSNPNVKCEVLELTINQRKEEMLEKILAYDVDTVAFSTYIWNVGIVLWLSKEIKKQKDLKILLGGPEVSYNSEEILRKNDFVDYVISGEGEEPFAQYASGEDVQFIDGISYKKCGDVVVKTPFVSFVDPPDPYTEEYMRSLGGRIAYIETSRGCPFHCAFCLSGRCGGVRFFDFEESKSKIIRLANSGTQTVKFIDRTFNADKKRAREIISFIINEYGKSIPKGVCFHFEIEGELLDDETIKLLGKAPNGLFQLEIGVQSFNEKTLLAVNRRSHLDILCKRISELILLNNIHIHIDLIIGLPNEDYESFKQSFNSAYMLKPHMLQIGFLKLLHGAELREQSEEYNCIFSDTPPYEIMSNKWLSAAKIKRLHLFEDVFERMYNSQRFGLTIEYLNSVFENQFDMYMDFAEYVSINQKGKTLDDFTKLIYDYFGSQGCVDKKLLRDVLAIDRLSTNRMGYLPDFLRVHSPKIKEALNALEKNKETKRRKNIKRAATILLTDCKLAYVDYDEINYISNRFLVKFTEI